MVLSALKVKGGSANHQDGTAAGSTNKVRWRQFSEASGSIASSISRYFFIAMVIAALPLIW
jgi:hypothetical protein